MSRVAGAEGGIGQERSGRLTFVSVVTALYAIMVLLTGLVVIGTIVFAGRFAPSAVVGVLVVTVLFAALIGGLYLGVAYGLWNRRSWGRSLGFVVHVLAVVGSIPLLAGGLIWVLPSFVLSGAAVYFLYDEGVAFQ